MPDRPDDRHLIYRPQAQDDLDAIQDYIAGRNPQLAKTFIASVLSSVEHLLRFPELGRARPDLRPQIRMLVVQRRVIVAYMIVGNAIEILRFFGAGQDYEAILGEEQSPPG